MNKYCRICWNTASWTKPTGEAAKLEISSYVREYGFGHEEWLLDLAWPISGYKGSPQPYSYGFLQPIGKYRATYTGKTMDVCLYTVGPDLQRLFVGVIRNLYVPDDAELNWALKQFSHNGKLQKMNQDLRRIGITNIDVANPPAPGSFANVRFRSIDVQIFDPRPTADATHKVWRTNRYQPLDWDGVAPSGIAEIPGLKPPSDEEANNPERSESLRRRSAVSGTQYSPEHVRLQNALYRHLVKDHGKASVDYEENFVDITLREPRRITFFEIKTAVTVKGCVREAVGQLLEYVHYAELNRASRLVVIGAATPTTSDKAYLAHLRKLYSLPISYRRWSWETLSLDPAV